METINVEVLLDDHRQQSNESVVADGRSIICIDLDCFFVQVEKHRHPNLASAQFVAVQQHDDIIAVSYPARSFGVQKHDTPQAALKKCGNLTLVHVPVFPGTSKVTYQHYRSHSNQIFECITTYLRSDHQFKFLGYVLEKASIDEAYIDVTQITRHYLSRFSELNQIDEICKQLNSECLPLPNQEPINFMRLKDIMMKSHDSSSGSDEDSPTGQTNSLLLELNQNDSCLFIASVIACKIRNHLRDKLGYEASCGIAPNKFLSKLASAVNKPNKQTLIFNNSVNTLLQNISIDKIPRLAAIVGSQDLKDKFLSDYSTVRSIADLQAIPLSELDEQIGEKGADVLYRLCRGIDKDPVVEKGPPRQVSVSMSLTPIFNENMEAIRKVIGYLVLEIFEKVKEDTAEFQRTPTVVSCKYRLVDCKEMSTSISITSSSILEEKDYMHNTICDMFQKSVKKNYSHVEKWGLRWIGVFFSSFIEVVKERETITSFFSKQSKHPISTNSVDTLGTSTTAISAASSAQNTSAVEKSHSSSHLFQQDKNSTKCPICSRSIPNSLITIHVNNHLDHQQKATTTVTGTKKQTTPTTSSKKRKQPPPSTSSNNSLLNYFNKKKKTS